MAAQASLLSGLLETTAAALRVIHGDGVRGNGLCQSSFPPPYPFCPTQMPKENAAGPPLAGQLQGQRWMPEVEAVSGRHGLRDG